MLRKMFYRGPSRHTLHEEYAKRGRIDAQAPIVSLSEIVVAAPVDAVWHRLVNLLDWPSFAPSIRDVRIETGIEVDAYFRFRLYNFPIRARFAVIDPGRQLTWTGESLWFTAIDRHTVEPVADDATRVSIAESFSGLFAVPLMSPKRLKAQHEEWLRSFKQAVEQEQRR